MFLNILTRVFYGSNQLSLWILPRLLFAYAFSAQFSDRRVMYEAPAGALYAKPTFLRLPL